MVKWFFFNPLRQPKKRCFEKPLLKIFCSTPSYFQFQPKSIKQKIYKNWTRRVLLNLKLTNVRFGGNRERHQRMCSKALLKDTEAVCLIYLLICVMKPKIWRYGVYKSKSLEKVEVIEINLTGKRNKRGRKKTVSPTCMQHVLFRAFSS